MYLRAAQAALDALRPVPGQPCPCCAKSDDALADAARAMIAAFDEAVPHLDSLCVFVAVHHMKYQGPMLSPAIKRLRAELGR